MTILKYSLLTIITTMTLWGCSSSKAEEKASSVSNTIQSSSESATTKIKEVVADKKEDLDETIADVEKQTEQIKETLENKVEATKEKLEEKTQEVKEKATELVANTKKDINSSVEKKVDQVTEAVPAIPDVPTPNVAVKEVVFNHDIFNGLLRKHVSSSGKVNYNGFKSERAELQTYLKLLKNNEPEASWSRNEKLAYWINVYNAFTIELILKNYPTSSIMNINGGKAWDIKFVTIGENTYSLNDVEHNIIRKRFKEPRIHFACVCAAKSCPKLLNKAYTEGNLNSSLDSQTRYFINTSGKNQISSSSLKLSKLFDWYAGDFGDVKTYIKKYSTTSFSDDASISFLDYNWDLNN